MQFQTHIHTWFISTNKLLKAHHKNDMHACMRACMLSLQNQLTNKSTYGLISWLLCCCTCTWLQVLHLSNILHQPKRCHTHRYTFSPTGRLTTCVCQYLLLHMRILCLMHCRMFPGGNWCIAVKTCPSTYQRHTMYCVYLFMFVCKYKMRAHCVCMCVCMLQYKPFAH